MNNYIFFLINGDNSYYRGKFERKLLATFVDNILIPLFSIGSH